MAMITNDWLDSVSAEFKKPYYRDFISNPTMYGYQSLHITFYDNSSRSYMEVQLRTKDMDDVAEIGTANHIGYEKEQEHDRARRDAVPEGECQYFDEAYERGYDTALLIGIFQLIAAVFPGTSRSGATIVGALLIGVSRTVAAEYTFFLAIPVMFGASILKLFKFGFHFTGVEAFILILGMVVAFVVSLFVIKFLMGYIKKHNFIVFGWYRIVLGVIVLGCGIAGLL